MFCFVTTMRCMGGLKWKHSLIKNGRSYVYKFCSAFFWILLTIYKIIQIVHRRQGMTRQFSFTQICVLFHKNVSCKALLSMRMLYFTLHYSSITCHIRNLGALKQTGLFHWLLSCIMQTHFFKYGCIITPAKHAFPLTS